jgi:hypothetical protein
MWCWENAEKNTNYCQYIFEAGPSYQAKTSVGANISFWIPLGRFDTKISIILPARI